MLAQLAALAQRGFGRIVPEPFVTAVLLGSAVMLAAFMATGDPIAMLRSWAGAKGLWSLLGFSMQMSLMLLLGSVCASAPLVQRGLRGAAGLAGSPRRLVGLTAAAAIGLALLNWSLGLIGGAVLAREAGRRARAADMRLPYPLLCAAGYSGLMVWHGGLSGSAPLKSTNMADLLEVMGPDLAARLGEIPLEQTLFSPLNLWVTGGLLLLGPLLFAAMVPSGADAIVLPEHAGEDSQLPEQGSSAGGMLDRLERWWGINLALALPLLAAFVLELERGGIGKMGLDTVNLALLACALLLHPRPNHFLAACEASVRACTGVILQFPIYAGIMGIMAASGLARTMAETMIAVGRQGFLLLGFLSAGLLNLFIPSGGGQWAVQGPILAEAALRLGVPPGQAVMVLAYGDQWTNMLQPFWALPLLAITGARARDIVGYCAVWLVLGGAWIAAVLLAFSG